MQKNRPKIGCGGASLVPKLLRGFGPNHWKLRPEVPRLKTAAKAPNRPSGPHWFLWNGHLKLCSLSPLLFIIMRVVMFIDLIYFHRLKTDPLISIVCLVCLSMRTKARCYPGRKMSLCICTWNSNSYWRLGWHGTWYRGQGPAMRKIYTHHLVDCWPLRMSQAINYKSLHFSLIPLEGDSYRQQGWCNNRIVASPSLIHSP